jgi:hypothetical protein
MSENVNPGSSSGKKMCISCQTDIAGRRALPVKEDRIIKTIRAIKKALGIAQMNQLFVCEGCMSKHNERRRSFEKTLLFASVLAGILLILLILVPMLYGRFEPWAILSGIIVAGIVVFIPIMFKYVPAVVGVSASYAQSTVQARSSPPIPAYPREPYSPPAPAARQQPYYPPAQPAQAAAEKPKAAQPETRPVQKKEEKKESRSTKKSRKK